jgi:hypothetical protein
LSFRIPKTPASQRLRWILDGLDGVDGWGDDAGTVLAPEFLVQVPAQTFVDVVRKRSTLYAPVSVTEVKVDEHDAQARIAAPGGDSAIVHCQVEAEPPHRITRTWTAGFVPDGSTTTDPTPRCGGRR